MGWPVQSLCQIAAGEGQDALHDPDPYPGRGAAAVLFQIELAFERVVDRLDDLA